LSTLWSTISSEAKELIRKWLKKICRKNICEEACENVWIQKNDSKKTLYSKVLTNL